MARKSIASRGGQLLEFAEKLRAAGLNWLEANNVLYGPGGRYSELFPTASERAKFAGSPEDKALSQLLESLPDPESSLPGKAASGKLNVRMPKALHSSLIHEADREGVSLNQLILSKLSLQLQAATNR